MRLKSLRLERYGPFSLQEMSLAPLTILFGPNGVGKSTILNAIEEALTLSGGRGLNGFASAPFLFAGQPSSVVYATLDERLISGSSDGRIMRQVLWKNLENIDDDESLLLDFDFRGPALKELWDRKLTEMVESGNHGSIEARTQVA